MRPMQSSDVTGQWCLSSRACPGLQLLRTLGSGAWPCFSNCWLNCLYQYQAPLRRVGHKNGHTVLSWWGPPASGCHSGHSVVGADTDGGNMTWRQPGLGWTWAGLQSFVGFFLRESVYYLELYFIRYLVTLTLKSLAGKKIFEITWWFLKTSRREQGEVIFFRLVNFSSI